MKLPAPVGKPGDLPEGVGDPGDLPDPATFLSGESGGVSGIRLSVTRTLADAGRDLAALLTMTGPRLHRLAASQDPLRVLVLSIYRPRSRLPGAVRHLSSERHDVHFALGSTGLPAPELEALTVATALTGGKFENVNRLLAETAPLPEHDWVIVTDDDLDLPPHFLDRMLALCERLNLDLAQPAQTMRSHAAWRVTRRQPWSLARLTQYVEIGPLTVFRGSVARELMPFPGLRFGWGLDNYWGALARERGWRLGVVDALPVRHEFQEVATTYTHAEAIAEARRFLADKPYIRTEEAQRTLSTIRRIPS